MTDPKDWIALIESKADALRRVGVSKFELSGDGCRVELHPADPPTVGGDKAREETEVDGMDPLNDPATFGGNLPGYVRLHRREELE